IAAIKQKLGEKAGKFLSKPHRMGDYKKRPDLFDASAILKDMTKFTFAMTEATQSLQKIGMPRQRRVLVIMDLSGQKNPITGGGVGGLAYRDEHGIAVDTRNVTPGLLVHEWAHMYWFQLPKKSRAYFSVWYAQNVVRTLAKEVEKGLPKDFQAETIELILTLVDNEYLDLWGLTPKDYMKLRKQAGDFTSTEEGLFNIVIDRFTNRRDVELRGELRQTLKPDPTSLAEPGGMVKGMDVVLYPDTDPKEKRAGIFTEPGAAFVKMIPLSQIPDVVRIDWTKTAQENRRELNIAQLEVKLANLSKPVHDQFGKTLEVVLEKILYGTTMQLRFSPHGISLLDIFPHRVFQAIIDNFVRTARATKEEFAPHLTLKQQLQAQPKWSAKPEQAQSVVAARIDKPEGVAIRMTARRIGKVPTAYAASSTVELWAETVAYAASKPSKLSSGLKTALRNVVSGKVTEALAVLFTEEEMEMPGKLAEEFVHEQDDEEEPKEPKKKPPKKAAKKKA
ncbi:hypothetical protein LCGC14_2481960, partial [marine sediment metagenome]